MPRDRKCKHCGNKKPADEGFQTPIYWYCDTKCAFNHSQALREKKFKKGIQRERKKSKEARARQRERRKEVKPLKYWQDKLQHLVNQYVTEVRDKDKPCCTCGTDAPDIKYDAGHYRTRKAAPELRYELTNIHIQCSQQCNVFGSGMRNEYREFIKKQYGQEHLDWLDGPHPSLKEQFPDWQAYEAEIKRYRQLLRDNGIKPRV